MEATIVEFSGLGGEEFRFEGFRIVGIGFPFK